MSYSGNTLFGNHVVNYQIISNVHTLTIGFSILKVVFLPKVKHLYWK